MMNPDSPRARPAGLQVDVVAPIGTEPYLISVGGDLDVAGVDRLRQACDQAIASGSPEIVLDLGACSFIDSSGLSVVVGLFRDACDAGRQLQIRPGGPAVRRTFLISGLSRDLPFDEDDNR
jgi:anti-sigma B factor antagonist